MPGQVQLAIGSKDRSVGWYDPPITDVDAPIRDLLENYSHIPADEVVPKIVEMRDKIWDVFPWPCVGQFRFLDLSLSRQPSYARILSLLMSADSKARILDVGCCFAQDLRKLARDGVPTSRLFGLEIQPEFIELGFEFFRDREAWEGRFVRADLMDRGNGEVERLLEEVGGGFEIVQLGMVLHIWDLEGQIKACERAVELLNDRPGVMVVGQSVGSLVAKEGMGRGKMIYKHDADSFGAMWEEVGRRTGTRWEVRAKLDEGLGIDSRKRQWDESTTRRLSFEVERV